MTTGSDDMTTVGEAAGHSGASRIATAISAIAFLFSGASFYTSVLQQAELEVHVPPVLQYARDAGGEMDVFAIPITIANNGANTGTVLAMQLTVTTASSEKATKTFYSAFVGEHPRNPDALNKTFAPISVPGRGVFSDTIRFYPQGNPLPKVINDAGDYRFTLSVTIAEPAAPALLDRLFRPRGPEVLAFTRTLPYLSEQHLAFRRGTISMHDRDWKPTSSGAK